MSQDAYQEIMSALDEDSLRQLEQELGVEGTKTREATGAAVGTILEGLRRRAGQQAEKPESGGGLEDLLERFGRGRQAEAEPTEAPQAEDAFGDIFGDQGQDVERRFGKAIRIDPGTVKKIFGAVLPIVLGALAKARKAAPESGGSGGSLEDILGKTRREFDRRTAPKEKSGGGGIFEAILDRDQDGDVDLGDLASIFLKR